MCKNTHLAASGIAAARRRQSALRQGCRVIFQTSQATRAQPGKVELAISFHRQINRHQLDDYSIFSPSAEGSPSI
jgi:hypothetical protein